MVTPFGDPGAIRAIPPTAGHLGQGVAYPPALTPTGQLALSAGQDAVEDALRSMIETAKGERVMLGDYGAGEFLFDPIDLDRGRAALAECIAQHEPRVASAEIEAPLDQPAQGIAGLAVRYSIAQQATTQTLTYPTFVGPSVP